MAGIDNRREKLNKRSPSETSYNFVRWRGPCLCPCSFLILVALLPSNDVKRRRRRGYGWILASASSASCNFLLLSWENQPSSPSFPLLPLSRSLLHCFCFLYRDATLPKKRKKGKRQEKRGKKQRGRTKRCRDRGDAKRTKMASGGKLKGGRDVNENDNVEAEL